jgi:CBS domain
MVCCLPVDGGMKEHSEDLSVTVCDVVRPDGTRARGLRAYCPRRSQSVSLETCRACPRLVEIRDDASGAPVCIRCTPGMASTSDPAEVAVGALIAGRVSAVRSDVSEHAIRALFVEHSLSLVVVVDHDHRVIGVVGEGDLIHRGFAALQNGECAGEIMRPALSIREETPVRTALLQMATSRVRHAPVITAAGELIGTLIDVVGLRWLRGGGTGS